MFCKITIVIELSYEQKVQTTGLRPLVQGPEVVLTTLYSGAFALSRRHSPAYLQMRIPRVKQVNLFTGFELLQSRPCTRKKFFKVKKFAYFKVDKKSPISIHSPSPLWRSYVLFGAIGKRM